MGFDNIPLELKKFNSWVTWRYEDRGGAKPTKVLYCPNGGYNANVNKPETWCDFETCKKVLEETDFYDGIGFVLSEADPYTFIDFDDPYDKFEDQQKIAEEFAKQTKIFNTFKSYSEISPSGRGLHILVKGSLPQGKRRGTIEIYSNQRFMTVTGNTYENHPITNYQARLDSLYNEMNQNKNTEVSYLGLDKEEFTDEQILERAYKAVNGEKFVDLYEGNWENYYSSQSEADFALLDILAFYSRNRLQIVRIFRQSELGQREKAKRNSTYIKPMLDRVFDRTLPTLDFEALRDKIEKQIAENNEVDKQPDPTNPQPYTRNSEDEEKIIASASISLPPGLVGEIAQFIYAQAPRPVQEIAIAGAIGMMAGICGRAYNISGTGLNQYILTLADTGAGKEALASGIDKLIARVVNVLPEAILFMGPSEIASSQALAKYMGRTSSSFVSVVGEFGLYLQQMSTINAPHHLQGLRRALLDLYNKSGEGKVQRGSIYSDKDKNTKPVLSPAFTVLGESTPEKFYEGLHEGMLTEGLLPRFTIIEYAGDRPVLNENHSAVQPSFELIDRVAAVCSNAISLNNQNKVEHIQQDYAAQQVLREYNVFCDKKINSSGRENKRHFWNRAHMKALKLAGLISVGCNPYTPSISYEVACWAIDITNRDVENMLDKFENGSIVTDNSELGQLRKVLEIIRDFCTLPYSEVSKYLPSDYEKFHVEKIVPYAYLQRRLASGQLFKKDRMGGSFALKKSLKTLCERGDIQEVGKAVLSKEFNTTAMAFAVKDMGLL